MDTGDLVLSVVIVIVTFNVMRQMEVWLHRHIFKVGWLITKNYRTTTILYYTFFLPGIVLNQFARWFVAGVLDVQAKHAIALPEKQEIGELKLDFIKISPKASPLRLAIIKMMPFLAGLLVVLLVSEHIFDISSIEQSIREGTNNSLDIFINRIITTSDFWLWAYLLFTVSNTMSPDFSLIKNYQRNLMIVFAAICLLVTWGVGQAVIGDVINGPISQVLNLFSTAFVVIVVFDLVWLIILAIVENTIEYITGDSATFKNGKMIAMSRKEIREEREKQRRKEAVAREEKKKLLPAGPPSIYNLTFIMPEGPSTESITGITELILPEEKPLQIERPTQAIPTVIESTAKTEIRFNTSREVIEDDDSEIVYEDVEDVP